MYYNTNPILYRITHFLLYYEVIETEKFLSLDAELILINIYALNIGMYNSRTCRNIAGISNQIISS